MEKILVAMDPVQSHFFAGIHALNLAKRINSKLLFLLIFPLQKSPPQNPTAKRVESAVKKQVEALIEQARSDGITIDYYLAYGDFEQELVNFVHENKVTLLIMECPDIQGDVKEAAGEILARLRHRISCRIEVVCKKTEIQRRKE